MNYLTSYWPLILMLVVACILLFSIMKYVSHKTGSGKHNEEPHEGRTKAAIKEHRTQKSYQGSGH